MATITVVGTGPGPIKYLTKEAETELLRGDKVFEQIQRDLPNQRTLTIPYASTQSVYHDALRLWP